MKKIIDDIQKFKETIIELKKSEELTEEQISEFKAIVQVIKDLKDQSLEKNDEVAEMSKDDLIKALNDAGHRESALLLKNWGEMDDTATALSKGSLGDAITAGIEGSGSTPQDGMDAAIDGMFGKEEDDKKKKKDQKDEE